MASFFYTLIAVFVFIIHVDVGKSETPEEWRQIAKNELDKVLATKQVTKRPKNVIFFLGDGMGISTLTAARIYKGQLFNKSGEEGSLTFEQFPFTGLIKTYNDDAQVADSAGAATAFFCGEKTHRGVLGVNSRATLGDCASATGNHITSIIEWAQEAGKATGIVTTARITHATPAALFAHTPHRDWEDDRAIPAEESACKDIAWQLVMDKPGKGVKVLFGGGRRSFLPNDASDPHTANVTGLRKDGRNLMELWKSQRIAEGKKAVVIVDRQQLWDMKATEVEHVLGVFAYGHFELDLQRERLAPEQPTIEEMTTKAVEILRRDPAGFYLAVEGGRIDNAHHKGQAKLALHDTVAFDNAIEATVKMLTARELAETLIIVTADHSHTFSFGGKPKRGNPILEFGGYSNSSDNYGERIPNHLKDESSVWSYTSLAYANGPGGALWLKRGDLTQVNPASDHENFNQDAAVPLKTETHGGEDVAIYATGPFAHLMVGLHEQHYIPVAIDYAACYRSKEPAHCKNIGLSRYGKTIFGPTSFALFFTVLRIFTEFV